MLKPLQEDRPKPPKGKPRRKRTRKAAQINSLSSRLIDPDPLSVFADNCKQILPQWTVLLRETTPPANITSSDLRFVNAFRFIDMILCGKEASYLHRRLAYIQHLRLFESLEATIKTERETGVRRESGYRDVSIALDIYESAQESPLDAKALRSVLCERRRTSRRWMILAGPSPLFLLLYSKIAETVVHRSSGVDKATMTTLAANVQQNAPSGFVDACAHIARIAEEASISGDMRSLQNVMTRSSLLSRWK
ncbi:hypothetical protein LZ30DRAFT_659262 [Colletotrichum cereale]|nr:hypothetical protein LZ30DRAFT_659262 [Colletotrichum cereale]